MKAIAIVQARLNSVRLPRKVLAEIEGHPLLWHVVQRARAIPGIDEVVLAIPEQHPAGGDYPYGSPDPLALAEATRDTGRRLVYGPEEDVLQRFLLALRGTGADYVVRVCGDAPLFCPEWAGYCLARGTEAKAGLVLARSPAVYHGCEVFSVSTLLRTWVRAEAGHDVREHVSTWARESAERCDGGVLLLPPPGWAIGGDLHLSVDTAEDLELVRRVYRELYRPGELVRLEDAVTYLRRSHE